MTLDRRAFLRATGAGLGAAWIAPGALSGSDSAGPGGGRGAAGGGSSIADRARQERPIDELYDSAIVVDSLAVGHVWDEAELEAVERSGYTAIQTTLGSRDLEAATQELAEWNARCRTYGDRLLKATSAADIERAKREGKMAVVFGFQNATMIHDDVDNLDVLYDLGARCIQLTYNSRNLLGNGCTERVDGGLSDFGVTVVERMNELGIVVDLSHCGDRTTMDGIAFSDPPACFTHTMCEALYPGHPRAKSDEQIRKMAGKGGVIGIAALGYFVGPDPGGETTVETYLDHIDHAVDVAGLEGVGLATDFQVRGIASWATRESWYEPRLRSFKPSYQVRWPPWIPELDEPERFRSVARLLRGRGYADDAIEKILGGNWLRYFRSVMG